MEFEPEDNDYDVYGDTRNRKGKIELGYNSHSKSYKDQKRIFYAKQKRLIQSEADRGINNDFEEEEEEKVDKSKKRYLKKTLNEDDANYGNNYTPIEKKAKKKKKKENENLGNLVWNYYDYKNHELILLFKNKIVRGNIKDKEEQINLEFY